jgi:hypothetical protein
MQTKEQINFASSTDSYEERPLKWQDQVARGFSAKVLQYGKPLGEGRFRFFTDIEASSLPLLEPYQKPWQNGGKTRKNKELLKTKVSHQVSSLTNVLLQPC